MTGKTIREIAALTSQALKKAVRQKRIERNPMEFVDRPRCVPKEVECPETHEFESLLTRIQNARYYAMAIFLANSACRRGEALALRWADVNLATGWITVSKSLSETPDGLEVKTTKSGKTRSVKLSESTIQVLLRHRDQIEQEKWLCGDSSNDQNLVFPTPVGSHYVPSQITNRLVAFMKEVGIKSSMHSLRHYNISTLLSRGVPLPVVSKRAGHANPQVTLNIYSHVMKGDAEAASVIWENANAEIIARTQPVAQSRNFASRMCTLVPQNLLSCAFASR